MRLILCVLSFFVHEIRVAATPTDRHWDLKHPHLPSDGDDDAYVPEYDDGNRMINVGK